MKIYHLELAHTIGAMSGGEQCMLQVIRYLATKDIQNIILTTEDGKKTYENFGVKTNSHITYVTIPDKKNIHIFFEYILHVRAFFKISHSIVHGINTEQDILMCHSDFFPNTIPAAYLQKFFKKKPFFWFHMKAPKLCKGYEGEFTGTYTFPSVSLVHFKLNQLLFYILSKRGKILIVNPYYKTLFKNRDVYTISSFAAGAPHIPIHEKLYDIAFIGRFHRQKGLLDIPDILAKVREKKPDVLLLIIGDGDKKLKEKFFSKMRELHLEKHVDYRGAINSEERFDLLAKSNTFLFPSYYESYGIVALEAMSCGMPVVAYDLPVFAVFKRGMITVPIKNTDAMAEQLVKLLSDKVYFEESSTEAKSYADTFSWDATGEEIYQLIMNA